MEYQKITSLLGTTSDDVPIFIIKRWIEVHDQSSNAEDRCKPSKQIRCKTSMLRSGKELLMLQIQIIMRMTKN